MNRGMLWFDNDPKTKLTAKVQRAAEYYRRKYGAAPNLCFVHPSMLADKMAEDGKITSAAIVPFCLAIYGLALLKRIDCRIASPFATDIPQETAGCLF